MNHIRHRLRHNKLIHLFKHCKIKKLINHVFMTLRAIFFLVGFCNFFFFFVGFSSFSFFFLLLSSYFRWIQHSLTPTAFRAFFRLHQSCLYTIGGGALKVVDAVADDKTLNHTGDTFPSRSIGPSMAAVEGKIRRCSRIRTHSSYRAKRTCTFN